MMSISFLTGMRKLKLPGRQSKRFALTVPLQRFVLLLAYLKKNMAYGGESTLKKEKYLENSLGIEQKPTGQRPGKT